jgi:hypothetical protein
MMDNMPTRAQAFWSGARRGGKLGAIVGVAIVSIGLCGLLVMVVLIPDLKKEIIADLKNHTAISAIGSWIFGYAGFVMTCAIPGAIMMGVIEYIRAAPVRFSLRTLLIATTLVAAALGLIVWSVRG